MLVCKKCGYSYSGNGVSSSKHKYGYYICVGGRNYCYRSRTCDNKPVRSDILENSVWEEIKNLLNNPINLKKECQRRWSELVNKPDELERSRLEIENKKLQNSIARLIDCYAEGFINKQEFEPRIKTLKLRLYDIEYRINQSMSMG